MYVDSHVHLQPHGEAPPMTIERIKLYVESARANGVERIAITEHLFRFQEAYDALYGWWDADPNPALAAAAAAYFRDHVSGTVAEYVRVVEQAKSAGMPVLLGIEMDWFSGHEETLRTFLAPYDWDIVLGSVHCIGSWGFDAPETPVYAQEWEKRDTDAVFADYGTLLQELAESGLCDVLAHPDLPKLLGHRPSSFTPLHDAIISAAKHGSHAIEINANGFRKPVAEQYPALPVLQRAQKAGLPVTLASDAHHPERVGQRFDDIAALASSAGYREFVSFEARKPRTHALPATAAQESGSMR